MKNTLILAFLALSFSVLAQKPAEVLVAAQDEQFISLKYSVKNQLLYTSTSKGRMIVLNDQEMIIKTIPFGALGTIDLDPNGELGAFTDEGYNVHIFSQKTFEVLESFKVTTQQGQGAMRVIFTKHGIYFSTFMNVYYRINSQILNVSPSFGVLDYDYKNDIFLLGKWEPYLRTDRKVQKSYIAAGSNFKTKKPILSITNSFELYSYLTDNSSKVISYDGKGNYYCVTISTGEKNSVSQEGIDESNRMFGLAKINDSTLMHVQRTPLTFVFEKSLNHEVVKLYTVKQSVVDNQIVKTGNTIYYITSGGNGNKLISIK